MDKYVNNIESKEDLIFHLYAVLLYINIIITRDLLLNLINNSQAITMKYNDYSRKKIVGFFFQINIFIIDISCQIHARISFKRETLIIYI